MQISKIHEVINGCEELNFTLNRIGCLEEIVKNKSEHLLKFYFPLSPYALSQPEPRVVIPYANPDFGFRLLFLSSPQPHIFPHRAQDSAILAQSWVASNSPLML
jgi:hypothetical protein